MHLAERATSSHFFEEDKINKIINFQKRFINWQRTWSRINEKDIRKNNEANEGKVAIINYMENKYWILKHTTDLPYLKKGTKLT